MRTGVIVQLGQMIKRSWKRTRGGAKSLALGVLGLVFVDSAALADVEPRFGPPVRSEWRAAQRAAAQTHWEAVTFRTNRFTGRVISATNSFVELGAGLNVPDASGQFVPANPSFQITTNGAEASGTAHKVRVPADIWLGDGIQVTKPDGQRIVLQPLCLDYFDPVDGRSLLLDAVTNAVGWLTASNEIVFSNCFTRIKASIRLRNLPWGLEHDVILHERPEDPSMFGFSEHSRLEMLTEQIDGATPTGRDKVLHQERDPVKLATMREPHFFDGEVDFGGMKMGSGRAFSTARSTNQLAAKLPNPVGKTFQTMQQRRVLIEALEHRQAAPALRDLPVATNTLNQTTAALSSPSTADRLAGLHRLLPNLASTGAADRRSPTRHASIRRVGESIRATESAFQVPKPGTDSGLIASASATPSFVIDYQLVNVNGVTDYRFYGGTNYLISTWIPLEGTTVIEGGAVIKFLDGAGLFLPSGATLVCDTTNYLPAVFTSADDNSVGEVMPGSTGNPTRLGGVTAFDFDGGNHELRNFRFKHLSMPVLGENGADLTLRNVQILDAYCGLWFYGNSTLNIFNGLAENFDFLYIGDTVTFRAEHLTTRDGVVMGYTYNNDDSTALFRNSFIVNNQYPLNYSYYPGHPMTYLGLITRDKVLETDYEGAYLTTLIGGAYYQTLDSPHRNTGSPSIDSRMRAEFAEMTTHPPTLLTGILNTAQTLLPVVPRDADAPDLGWHYPAVDYVARNLELHNATLDMRGGVVLAGAHTAESSWASVYLSPGKILSMGQPTRLNRILRLSQIQENCPVRGDSLLVAGNPDQFKPELRLRFTEFSSLAGESGTIYWGGDAGQLESCHSAYLHSSLALNLYGGTYQTAGFTNNLFRHASVQFNGQSPAYLYAYNNTFLGGAASFAGGNNTWRIQFNIFDHANVTADNSPFSGDQNAYYGLARKLREDTYVQESSLAYASGPLGRHYLAGTALQNAGSLTAGTLGLFHFTTRTSQTKEGASAVDLGFHYVSLTELAGGLFETVDTDLDGIADYREDTNGNGLWDGTEFNYESRDTNEDGEYDDIQADTENPRIQILDQHGIKTSQPLLQLVGMVDEPVTAITYSVYDFTNTLTSSGLGFLTNAYYDARRHTITTNTFQCFDVELTPGLNRVVLKLTDRAGLSTVLTNLYELDYSIDTHPPTLILQLPNGGNFIASQRYDIHGTSDDPSAEIIATVVSGSDSPFEVRARAFRTGKFVIENIPLKLGVNAVTVVARDKAGNTSSGQQFQIMGSPIQFTIDPPSFNTTYNTVMGGYESKTVNVGGIISDPNFTVWIGGIKAVIQNNTYYAANATLNPDGTLEAIAIPNADNNGNGAGAGGNNPVSPDGINNNQDVDEVPTTEILSIHGDEDFESYGAFGQKYQSHKSKLDWNISGGGKYEEDCAGYHNVASCHHEWLIGANRMGTFSSDCLAPYTRTLLPYQGNAEYMSTRQYTAGPVTSDKYRIHYETLILVHTKGKRLGQTGYRPILFSVSAYESTARIQDEFIDGVAIPSQQLKINTIGESTADCDGMFYVLLPVGIDITLQIKAPSQYRNYQFGIDVSRPSPVKLKWMNHPKFYEPQYAGFRPTRDQVEEYFNRGARMLATDNDQAVCELPQGDDPQSPSSIYRTDDVPLYREFFITEVNRDEFPPALSDDIFFNIQSSGNAFAISDQLHGVDVLSVLAIQFGNEGIHGMAPYFRLPILLKGPGLPLVNVHEWGHSRTLTHRGIGLNIGNANDSEALMWKGETNRLPGNKINRYERSFLQ